jgi:hypothetical protein
MAGKEGARVEVEVKGAREFQRDLSRVPRDTARNTEDVLERNANLIAAEARARAPRQTGRYAASIRARPSREGGMTVGSDLPQAGVLHYGGTIRPRGVDIRFPARPVISDALEDRADKIVDEVGDAVDKAARRAGFK